MLNHISTQLIDTRTDRYGLPLSHGRRLSIMIWIMLTTNEVAQSTSINAAADALSQILFLSESHSGVGPPTAAISKQYEDGKLDVTPDL